MEVERANVGEKIFSKNFTQMGDKSAVDAGAFSTTEHTEAAFAGTESGWGKGTETPNQPLYYPPTCGRFEHFFDTPFPVTIHRHALPCRKSSKRPR